MKKATTAVIHFALIGGVLPTGIASLFGPPSIVKTDTITYDGYDHVNPP